jgi:DMSO/TMAO reductase YedYZ molybdopterin-dependent catalytic subunit
MLIRSRSPHDLTESDTTPEALYWNRRTVVAGMLAAGLVPQAVGAVQAAEVNSPLPRLAGKRTRTLDEEWTSYDSVTHYNNFYEFGTGKEDPAMNARDAPHAAVDGEASTGSSRSRRRSTSRTPQAVSRWRNASIVCAASRAGRW